MKPELPATVLNPLTHAQLCGVFARYPAIDKVDLQSGDEIRNAKLKDHIRRVGKVLYTRQA